LAINFSCKIDIGCISLKALLAINFSCKIDIGCISLKGQRPTIQLNSTSTYTGIMVRTENPIFFWVASRHYKYGVLGLKFGLHYKYKIFYVKIWALRGLIQDDHSTQWKGTCEGDGWQDFFYLQNLPKRKIKNIIFRKWSVFVGLQSQEKQRTYAFQCGAKNTQGWLNISTSYLVYGQIWPKSS